MKTTLSATYRTMLMFLNQNSSRLQAAQVSVATGKRLNKGSDDPATVGPLLSARAQLQSADTFISNSTATIDRLKSQDSQLGQADSLLSRAIELTVAAGNGIYGAPERAVMATEISDLKAEMLSLANSRMGDRYFYGGFQDRTPPFVINPGYDPVLDPRPVLYNGDQGVVELEVAPAERMVVNFTGDAVFLGDGDGDGAVDAGQVDIFNVLASLEEALLANDQVGASAQLDRLNTAQDQIGVYRGRTGAAISRLDRSHEEMLDIQLDLKGAISRYEDVDLAEAFSLMTQQEQALEAALSVTGRISKLSILDYL